MLPRQDRCRKSPALAWPKVAQAAPAILVIRLDNADSQPRRGRRSAAAMIAYTDRPSHKSGSRAPPSAARRTLRQGAPPRRVHSARGRHRSAPADRQVRGPGHLSTRCRPLARRRDEGNDAPSDPGRRAGETYFCPTTISRAGPARGVEIGSPGFGRGDDAGDFTMPFRESIRAARHRDDPAFGATRQSPFAARKRPRAQAQPRPRKMATQGPPRRM